jgi:NarL family two-component system response regulator YdfI
VRHGVESAACMEFAATLIKVFIFADSTVELARLTAIVRSAPSLEFAAASLDREILTDQLEDIEFGVSVALLEHSSSYHSQNSSSDYSAADGVTRIILTEQAGFADAVAAMKETDSAIRAILPAWAGNNEIEAAIEAVSAGLMVIHPEVFIELTAGENERVTYIPEDASRGLPDSPIQQLSPRESEVLNLLADGFANKEIAWRLKISEHTVKFHVTSIFNKLNASTRAEAVAIGARRGLIIL